MLQRCHARPQSMDCSSGEKASSALDECRSKTLGELRNRQLAGFKFVRQEPVGSYVADFVCREARLIVEADGATHSTDKEIQYDVTRTAFLERLGYRVIRVQNDDIYNAMEGVLRTVLLALEQSEK